MRGTIAKRLRKQARVNSTPTEYHTKWFKFFTGGVDDKGEQIMDDRGTVTCTGYRRKYQDLKLQYKSTRGI